MPTDRSFGEFKFLVPVAKAVTGEEGELFVEGVASTPAKDREDEIITAKGQAAMARWANTGSVVLGGEADHFSVAFDDDLGTVVNGQVLEDGGFFVRAKLDADNPRAVHLHKKLASGTQLGLSVFGKVAKASRAEDGTPLIDDVVLKRITVVKRPVNPDTWIEAVAKSLSADWNEPGVDETPELAAEANPVEVAKGKFLELLRAQMQAEVERAPVDAQLERVGEISKMVGLLWDSAHDLDWASDLTSEQRATAIAGAIEEFKAVVLAKGESGPTREPEPEAETEEAPEPEAEVDVEEIGDDEEDETEGEQTAAKGGTVAPEPVASTHPAVRVANSFANAAHILFSSATEPAQQREGLEALVGKLAHDLDEAVPAPHTESDEPPAWAAKLLERIDALESRLEKANASAATAAKAEGAGDAGEGDLTKMRKSVAGPEIRPSRTVARAESFRDIVRTFYNGSEFPKQP